jgi:hypothetical protein
VAAGGRLETSVADQSGISPVDAGNQSSGAGRAFGGKGYAVYGCA